MNDYARIARIIRFLGDHYRAQPSLEAIAAHAGLSPFHLHRLFTSWAGVTPKAFLQCLTAEHARALLANGESVFESALDAGLSGPGRLHDLMVNLVGASPGEIKHGGAGLTLTYGFAASPFGLCLIGETERGLCQLAFVDAGSRQDALDALRKSWPKAKRKRDDVRAAALARQVFARPAPAGPAPLRAWVSGTAFQVRVWQALLAIPAGALVSYGAIAAALHNPGATRAVGSAVGANPLAYLIPCHRVIRESGLLGGYHWGLDRKQAMIAWESARSQSH